MAICRKCGELNKDGLKYCVYCGGELELTEASGLKRKQNTEPQFCPACGEKNPAMLSDCKYCGAKLDKYAYMGRIQQAEKKSVFETLGSTKKIVLFIVLVILVYALWFVRAFKGMKDYLTDNKMLVSSEDFYKLAAITAQNTADIAKIKEEMVTKSELDKFIKSFNDTRIAKEYVILNGQTVEANLAYSEIYALAKKTIYVVDNYIGLKTLSLLKSASAGVTATIFSDNIRNWFLKDILVKTNQNIF